MARNSVRIGLAASVLALTAGSASADRVAWIVGNASYAGQAPLDGPAADVQRVADRLSASGFSTSVLTDADAAGLRAIGGTAEEAVLFFSGHVTTVDGRTILVPVDVAPSDRPAVEQQGVPVDEILASIDAPRITLIVESCHEGHSLLPGGGRVTAPDDPRVRSVYSVAPSETCTSVRADLSDMLTRTLTTFDVTLEGAIDKLSSGPGATIWASERLHAAAAVGAVQNDTVVISAAVQPVNVRSATAPVIRQAQGASVLDDGVLIFAAQPAPAPASLPTPQGLPEPSIIVGVIEEDDPDFDVVGDDGTSALSGSELSIADPQEREALRRDNPTLFTALLDQGAFDPAQPELPRAIQTELARLNCYTAGIDGIWGAGSRNSVARYFAEAGGAPESNEPTIGLFRTLMAADEVRCPAVQVAAPQTTRTTTTRQNTRQTTTTRATQQRTAPAAPAPATQPSSGGRTIRSTGSTGVFR
ncbi:caspase family protein [Aestuariibius sp. 2305UL40-4]|uniref:caspase family protein n=1 Tax=Aestuariibius violaceus TaxID=3234132 RepID=UPI00345E0919